MSQNMIISISQQKYGKLVFITKNIIAFGIGILAILATISLTCPYCIIFQLILGLLYAHMVELQHEALHGATQWKQLNHCIGFFLGLPMLISYSDYQYHHMLHHQYVGTNKDTEYFNYSSEKTFSIYKFLISLFMFEHYVKVFKKIIACVSSNGLEIKKKKIEEKIRREYQLFAIILISIIGASIYYESFLALKLWIVPLFLFAAPIHFLIELPEHVFCEKNTDIYFNTRTIKSNWVISWFVNGNNYHVEHHYAPNFPIACLPELHHKISKKIAYFEKSYIEFYKFFFKKIMTREL